MNPENYAALMLRRHGLDYHLSDTRDLTRAVSANRGQRHGRMRAYDHYISFRMPGTRNGIMITVSPGYIYDHCTIKVEVMGGPSRHSINAIDNTHSDPKTIERFSRFALDVCGIVQAAQADVDAKYDRNIV